MAPFLIIAGMALLPVGVAQAAPMIDADVAIPLSTSTVRAAIEHQFGVGTIMVRIAACESGYRQFDELGRPLPGVVDPDDTGVFQINKRFHFAEARKMGIDFDTLEGNIEYARILLDRNGTADWKASRYCWG